MNCMMLFVESNVEKSRKLLDKKPIKRCKNQKIIFPTEHGENSRLTVICDQLHSDLQQKKNYFKRFK